LRIDEAIASGRFKETKTEGSVAWVWVPHPIMEQLLAWREVSTNGELIFPSRNGTPMNSKNFLRRHIWPAAVRAGIMTERPKKLPKGTRWIDRSTSVNFQAFRRTCATWFQKHGGVKDTQAHLRHSTPVTTMKHYIQEIPVSVRDAVKALDEQLFGPPDTQNLRVN
jgi:integrase